MNAPTKDHRADFAKRYPNICNTHGVDLYAVVGQIDRRKSRDADRLGSEPIGAFSAGVFMGCLLMIGVALVAITQGWLS